MNLNTRIIKNGKRIPVVAFFGTKGGVGKTTIARRFSELITLNSTKSNVLLVDSDVHHRGMTVEMTSQTPVSCKTVHDYVASQNTDDVEAVDMSGMVKSNTRLDHGRLFFIPASVPESDQVFEKSAKIGSEKLLKILYEIVSSAVEIYNCHCVVVDCGPIIDPYTAAAAMISDRAFIIGQNEPISFSSLKTYPSRIRDFYPDFRTDKMKIIINKVRGWDRFYERELQEDIFEAIPFTMDIVDISEGLTASNEMQLIMFEDHIAQIVEKVFKGDHPELIPEKKTLFPTNWKRVIDNPERFEKARFLKRLGMMRFLLPIGIIAILGGAILFYNATTKRQKAEIEAQAIELTNALKVAISEAIASGDQKAYKLEQALNLTKKIDLDSKKSLDLAIRGAKEAGLKEIPPIKRFDKKPENTSVVILLSGILINSIGFFCYRSRKKYLTFIQGIQKGGAQWLMSEIKAKQSSRKLLDRLIRTTQ